MAAPSLSDTDFSKDLQTALLKEELDEHYYYKANQSIRSFGTTCPTGSENGNNWVELSTPDHDAK